MCVRKLLVVLVLAAVALMAGCETDSPGSDALNEDTQSLDSMDEVNCGCP